MGILLDTTVFVDLERAGKRPSSVGAAIGALLGDTGSVGMAAITASELLHGVHRADPRNRARREAFVDAVISEIPAIGFDLRVARVHARLWADLSAAGVDTGAHDRLIAATALSLGWSVATANVRHFERIPGLDLVVVG